MVKLVVDAGIKLLRPYKYSIYIHYLPLVFVLWAWVAQPTTTWGASPPTEVGGNVLSPIGINLAGVTYYTSEQPFLDIFKTTGVSQSYPQGWHTGSDAQYDTEEEAYLQLDPAGFPLTLVASPADPHKPQLFKYVGVIVLVGLSRADAGKGVSYRPGKYVVLYDGKGQLSYPGATLLSSRRGRDVINIDTPSPDHGLGINITQTDPKDHIRNIRIVYATEEKLLTSGKIFRPGFISLLANFRVLRFMDWSNTNNSKLRTWTNRPQKLDGGWGTPSGVPLEVIVDLCNEVRAECWVNVPHLADDNYIRMMALLFRDQLDRGRKLYVEYSNEAWNSIFSQTKYVADRGTSQWPRSAGNAYTLGTEWHGVRTAQMCDIWKSVWGAEFSRVHCVLGAQAANPWTATEALLCPAWVALGNSPCYTHGITDVAIAPYFGFKIPSNWRTRKQTDRLSDLFLELSQGGRIAGDYSGGDLKQVSDWEAAYAKALQPFKLPLISYEGGQTFVPADGSDRDWSQELVSLANRDPRMKQAYLAALSAWKANGGQVYMQFVDTGGASAYGDWGAVESFLDTIDPVSKAPPKWQALQQFISNNRCWWPGCSTP